MKMFEFGIQKCAGFSGTGNPARHQQFGQHQRQARFLRQRPGSLDIGFCYEPPLAWKPTRCF